jgi:hypothetical protein
MSRSYFLLPLVTLVVGAAQPASAQSSFGSFPPGKPATSSQPIPPSSAPAEATCVVYRLSDLGNDPSLGKWVAETIPEMVLPGTWAQAGGIGKISYHPPTQVLVVYHTAAAHAKVEAFLRDVKKAAPSAAASAPVNVPASGSAAKTPAMTTGIQQARHTQPAQLRVADSAAGSTYLIPPPLTQPKHLFHLIIRYEGDGVSDTSAGSVKDLVGNGTSVLGAMFGLGNGPTAAKDGEKGSPQAGKGPTPSPSELFQIIVRYEGEGIIDANVVNLFKELQKGNSGWGSGGSQRCEPTPGTTFPSPSYLNRPSTYVPPADGAPSQPGTTPPATTGEPSNGPMVPSAPPQPSKSQSVPSLSGQPLR